MSERSLEELRWEAHIPCPCRSGQLPCRPPGKVACTCCTDRYNEGSGERASDPEFRDCVWIGHASIDALADRAEAAYKEGFVAAGKQIVSETAEWKKRAEAAEYDAQLLASDYQEASSALNRMEERATKAERVSVSAEERADQVELQLERAERDLTAVTISRDNWRADAERFEKERDEAVAAMNRANDNLFRVEQLRDGALAALKVRGLAVDTFKSEVKRLRAALREERAAALKNLDALD